MLAGSRWILVAFLGKNDHSFAFRGMHEGTFAAKRGEFHAHRMHHFQFPIHFSLYFNLHSSSCNVEPEQRIGQRAQPGTSQSHHDTTELSAIRQPTADTGRCYNTIRPPSLPSKTSTKTLLGILSDYPYSGIQFDTASWARLEEQQNLVNKAGLADKPSRVYCLDMDDLDMFLVDQGLERLAAPLKNETLRSLYDRAVENRLKCLRSLQEQGIASPGDRQAVVNSILKASRLGHLI